MARKNRRIVQVCNACGSGFYHYGKTNYCSIECYIIDHTEPVMYSKDDCWLWTGGLNSLGYGSYCFWGKGGNAQICLYEHLVGPTNGLDTRHKCRSRNCVNPNHIELGTRAENNRDRYRDGTTRKGCEQPHMLGEKNALNKLSESQVLEIASSIESSESLGSRFGCTPENIEMVRNGKTWSWLTGITYESKKDKPRPTRKLTREQVQTIMAAEEKPITRMAIELKIPEHLVRKVRKGSAYNDWSGLPIKKAPC